MQVKGSLIADDSLFDDQRLGWGWSWDETSAYYAAEISALTLNRNTIDVRVTPGKEAGAQPEARLVPATDYITIENTATTGKAGSRDTTWISRPMGQNTIKIGGSIPLGTKVTRRQAAMTVQDPKLYDGKRVCWRAGEAGNRRLAAALKPGKTPSEAKLVCSHTSPPLSKILVLLLKPSDNLVAEMLLKTLGSVVGGKGSSSGGRRGREGLCKAGSGWTSAELSIVDGSGLSRLDYVSPRNLVTLLSYMSTSKNSKLFMDALPVAGVDGTLAYRMRGTSAEKNVKAKTGTVAYVSTLSGYVNTKSGEPLVFSIMMNHNLCPRANVTKAQDEIRRLAVARELSAISGAFLDT